MEQFQVLHITVLMLEMHSVPIHIAHRLTGGFHCRQLASVGECRAALATALWRLPQLRRLTAVKVISASKKPALMQQLTFVSVSGTLHSEWRLQIRALSTPERIWSLLFGHDCHHPSRSLA